MHSTSAIVERFSEKGIRCDIALKALCEKKGLRVEVKLLLVRLESYISEIVRSLDLDYYY